MDYLGAPVLCDRLYAGHAQITSGEIRRRLALGLPPQADDDTIVLQRQALHARSIELSHPVSGKVLRIESPIPADLLQVCELLRQYRANDSRK
jgi:23S rRNA pseudouridine1911/1915/1917 synthase